MKLLIERLVAVKEEAKKDDTNAARLLLSSINETLGEIVSGTRTEEEIEFQVEKIETRLTALKAMG